MISNLRRPIPAPKLSAGRRAAILAFSILLFGGLFAASPTRAGEPATARNFDIRLHARPEMERLVARYGPPLEQLAAAQRRHSELTREAAGLRAALPGLELTPWTPVGSAEVVRRPGGWLSGPAPGVAGREVALAFLARHSTLYGLSSEQIGNLVFLGESMSPTGLRMVRLEQRVDGLPVFQGELRVLLDGEGRVLCTVGRLVPGLDAGAVLAAPPPPSREAAVAAAETAEELIHGHPVLFPLAAGLAVPARAQILTTRDGSAFHTVVTGDGTLLWRKNLRLDASSQEARFSVYVQADGRTPADNPAPGSPNSIRPGRGLQGREIPRRVVLQSRTQNRRASPDGWIPDGGETTTGNNVDAYLDADGERGPDPDALDVSGRPRGNPDAAGRARDFLGSAPRDFEYTPPPQGGNPGAGDDPATAAYRRGAVTQAFYTANWFHDRLHALGFDEAAGNFQQSNFGRGGTGGDRLRIEIQGSELTDNAFFQGGPDGTFARVRLFLFAGPEPARDAALDGEILVHELTHGLTTRLVGNGSGLLFPQGRALGEGWSDFYALALLNPSNADDPDGQYAAGAWSTYHLAPGFSENYLYGIRRFPYSTDNAVNPLTWGDTDVATLDLAGGIPSSPLGFGATVATEVHNAGELWALSLWEVRSRIIAALGGDVSAGNEILLQLVTDALKATPADPTFTDARDALLDVDCAVFACAHEEAIWAGFADRGLGWGASTSTPVAFHYGVRESFALPHLDVARVRVGSAGSLQPGETAELTVELFNPWRGAAKAVSGATARLTAASPGVTVLDGAAAWGPLAPRGTAASSDTLRIAVAPEAPCGGRLELTLSIDSSLGSVEIPLRLRVGTPGEPGEPQVFSRSIRQGLEIPDSDDAGVLDQLSLDEDLEIADLDLRIDELRHTWVGDLALALRGPGGYGFNPLFLPAGLDCFDDLELLGCNGGDDLVATVFDDEARRDLATVGSGAAPFGGRWLPWGNSPSLGDLGDPAGQLSRFDGTSTQGTWTLFAADLAFEDVGTLESWSLLVRPRTFVCDPATLGFAADAFPAGEASGAAEVTVVRSGSGDGPVSVRYTTSGLSAAAGEDYQPVAGTLSWAAGDREPKTFTVPVTADGEAERTELVRLTLSDPGGGAMLGLDTAVIPIRDDDRGPGCTGGGEALCLLDERFQVEVEWRDPRSGSTGLGGAVEGPGAAAGTTGLVWFFDPANVELIVKVLDGRPLSGAFWLFYGALSDVEYWVVVTDTKTGRLRVYRNEPFEICGQADTRAFPDEGGTGAAPPASVAAAVPGTFSEVPGTSTQVPGTFADTFAAATPGAAHRPGLWRAAGFDAAPAAGEPVSAACTPDAETLCLLDGRFQVRVSWIDPRSGDSGSGRAVPGTDATGLFWFFQPQNLELVVKALDATAFAGKLWIFYGALSDVEYFLEVTDTVSGEARTFHNPPFNLCGDADTTTFDGP